MVVLAVCVRARWVIHTLMSAHCATGLVYTSGAMRGRGSQKTYLPSSALGGKVRSGPAIRTSKFNNWLALRLWIICSDASFSMRLHSLNFTILYDEHPSLYTHWYIETGGVIVVLYYFCVIAYVLWISNHLLNLIRHSCRFIFTINNVNIWSPCICL